MDANFSEFYTYIINHPELRILTDTAASLFYATHAVGVFPVNVNSNGSVTYIPNLKNPAETRPRTTSLTRLVRYLSQERKELIGKNWQPLQDEIVKWAGLELGSNYWTFEEVKGTDIVAAYANGPRSCMRGKNTQLRMYVQNPDKVSLLKVYKEGQYVGRALIWTSDDGKRALDRTYPGDGTIAFAARRYAKSQGWNYKSSDGITGCFINTEPFSVTLKHPDNRRIPFLDSVRYVSSCNNENFTLTTFGVVNNGQLLTSVGHFEGICSALYSSTRYVDGGIVVRNYVLKNGYWRFTSALIPTIRMYGRANSTILRALRPTDVVYRLPTELYFRPARKIIEIDGKFYQRQDVRKRRGLDEYVPKEAAQAMVIDNCHIYENNAQAITLRSEV